MPQKGTIDAVFIFRSLQDEYCAKGKNCMCLADLDKSFDEVPRNVLVWMMMMKKYHKFCLDQ